LPNGKAPGPSGIPNEIIKILLQTVISPIYKLFLFCYQHAVIPDTWKMAHIYPLYKKKGDASEICNYRAISLTETLRKLFESVISIPLQEYTTKLHVAQGGFRPKRSTLDQITTLNEILKAADNSKSDIFITFLDIKAAYDTVYRPILWNKCIEQLNMEKSLVCLLQQLFDFNQSSVIINGTHSEPFPLHNGLFQVSILSPMLYAFFINDLASKLWQTNDAFTLWKEKIWERVPCLFYADDIALIATSQHRMQDLLNICDQHSQDNKYDFNFAKCEYLCNIRNLSRDRTTALTLQGFPIKYSLNFTYLGAYFE